MIEYKTQIINEVRVQVADLNREFESLERKVKYEEKIINGVRVYVVDLRESIEKYHARDI